MISRRRFIQQSSFTGVALGFGKLNDLFSVNNDAFSYESPYLKLNLLKDRPRLSFFSTDSLGGHQFSVSPLLETTEEMAENYEATVKDDRISYFIKNKIDRSPVWECRAAEKTITFHAQWKEGPPADPFAVTFSQKANHCTVLGEMTGEKQIKFPCLLHFPGMGTFRLYCSDPQVALFYDALLTAQPFVKIALPAADSRHPDITYRFESVAIYPEINKIKDDARYDGFRRNFINIFQLSPGFKTLANNSTSDACAFTMFLYAEMARATPPLVEGLTAMDLIRNSLDQYLNGMLGYGMVGKSNWRSEYNSCDSFPSLIMSACYYILDTKDRKWAEINYPRIREWAEEMIATDRNHDGIIEYGYSGNSGSWNGAVRPANWWDTIGFGHDDAYSNILAFQACKLLSAVAASLGKQEDSNSFSTFAGKLKNKYYDHFYNPETGVLAGWKSADGALHDYYFTFVNSMAVCYGLLNKSQSRKIMRRLLSKMKEVGYTDFGLGLPGNLIPVKNEDYMDKNKRWGYDNFQVYENGGATGCYAYYTIHALFMAGMGKEAGAILFPMLESYKYGGFEGYCSDNNMTKDWKSWKGECSGYEGFLVDNYLALLAVLDL